jgi:hypothetical protein
MIELFLNAEANEATSTLLFFHINLKAQVDCFEDAPFRSIIAAIGPVPREDHTYSD